MKNFYLTPLLCLCTTALSITSCTSEKEPEIATGASNIIAPVFLSAAVTPDTENHFQTIARLKSFSNLNILQHGWVWSETPNPTIEDGGLVSGVLTVDSFENLICDLELGKVYYFRPFVSTGRDIYYGKDTCSFLGVNFITNTDTEIFQGAEVRFTNTTSCNGCTYLWDLGDGTTSTETSPPVHTYNTVSNTTLRLTAYLSGCLASKAISLDIIPDPFQDYWAPVGSGTFMMGCTPGQAPCESNMLPSHEVTLGYSFDMGKTEITQRQWEAVVGENPSSFKQCGPDCPVESVSWNDITGKFIPALYRKTGRQHRLPTEAEWEYAARGGQAFRYSGSNDLLKVGWYSYNSDDTPHPVGSLQPNGFALKDMSGNVWEWVADDYHSDYTGAPQDGSAWINTPPRLNLVFRGGSWKEGFAFCRVAYRSYNSPAFKADNLGFRLVRTD